MLLPLSISDHRSGFPGLYQTAEVAFGVYIRPQKPYISNNYHDFLGEFEAIFKTALAHESGPKGDCLMKKNGGSKIS
jgi:hypothetical protein